ncbi:MAG: restriction endonuclease subunit S [Chloroflexota bacterium]|nr:restriction endonuclease subunit S [Chloroflexota bacterium]
MNGSTVRLVDLCELIAEPVRPGTRPGALYLGLEHLASGRLSRIGGGQASDMRSTTSAFQPGDVLYGKLRPYLDKAILAEGAGVCTTELLVLRAQECVDSRFLAAILHSPRFVEHAVAGTTGVQHPRTSWAHVREFEVPALSFGEQRQVADVLWLVHEVIRRSETLVEEGQGLKRAAMRTLFTRGLCGEPQKETEIGPVPGSWEVASIDDVAVTTQYGLSMRGQPSGAYPILRMNCQEDGKVHYRDIQFVELDSESYERFQVKPGDLLFNRTNSIELVGRMAIVEDDRPAVFASYLVRLVVDNNRCIPEFLNYFMNWPRTQEEIKKLASRAVGQANINATKLRTVLFPLPTKDEQQEIVANLDAIDRQIDLHRRKRTVLEELFKALLHKLMTGEVRAEELG